MKIDDTTIAIIILCVLATLGAGYLADLIFLRIKLLIRELVLLYTENRLYRAWKRTLEKKIDEATRVEKE